MRAETAAASCTSATISSAISARSAASSTVVMRRSCRTTRPSTITVRTARPASAQTTWRAALLKGTKHRVGQIEQHHVRQHAGPQGAKFAPQPGGLCTPGAGSPQYIGSVGASWRRRAERGQAARHAHRLEHVLRVRTAAVIAAKPDIDTAGKQGADPRHARPRLEIADRAQRRRGPRVADQLDLRIGQPNGMGEAGARPERAAIVQELDRRTAMRREVLPPLHGRPRRFVEVDVERERLAPAEVGQRRDGGGAEPVRRGRAEPERDARPTFAARCDERAEGSGDIGARRKQWPGQPGQTPLLRFGYAVTPECRGLQRRALGDVRGEDAAYANLVIRLQHGVHIGGVERMDTVHILHRRDAAMQALDCADQRARPQLATGAAGKARRQGEHAPKLHGHPLEEAFQQRVVRVVVRIDKPRQHQMVARIDHRRVRMQCT